MKRLKIGIFMDDFYPSVNGVVLVIDNYARRLSKIADVVVVVPYTDKDYKDDFPYKVIRVKSYKMHIIDYSFAKPIFGVEQEQKILDEKFDIIHIHSPFVMGYWGTHIAHLLHIPCIATLHTQFYLEFKRYTKSTLVSITFTKIMMQILNRCDKCYAVNPKVAEIFYKYGAKEMPGVLNNGTDLKLVTDDNADDEVNKMFGFKKDEVVLLFLGRINILKNVLFIVDVVNALKQKGLKFKMLFVGTPEDGDKLNNHITELGLDDDIIVAGKIMDRKLIAKIYHRAKLFVFPSLYDASSLVQIEAASQKTPTIFIDGSTTSCSVKNNVNGFLAPNNVSLFADRIIEILDDKELYNKVSEGAYRDIYKSWDDLTDGLYKLYLKTIAEYNKQENK